MTDPSIAFHRAFELQRQGLLAEALAAYDELLAHWPGHAAALHHSGLVLFQTGHPDAAARRIERSLQSDGHAADPWCNLGLVYQALGRHADAIEALHQALRRDAHQADIWNNLAGALLETQESTQAEQATRRALSLDPSHAASAFNLALCLEAQGRLDDALQITEELVQRAPNDIAAAGLKAQIEEALGRLDAAQVTLNQALARFPNHGAAAPLYFQRAGIEERQHALDAAGRSCEAVLRLDPGHGPALSELLFLRKRNADWRHLDALRARFREGVAAGQPHLSPFCYLSEPSTRGEQRRCAETWSKRFRTQDSARSEARRAISTAKLRIGYLSSDFHQHATAVLVAGLFEQHDRSRFEIVGYSAGPDDGSAMRARLEAGVDHFVDARGWPASRLVAQIGVDAIDILVDLKGHTHGAPTAVLALRPAPLQVSYLGYPGTTGASFMDYLIGDAVVTPFEHTQDYSETLVQLPGSYQINDRQRAITKSPVRRELGLPDDGFVFCCFNSAYKLNPEVFDAWARILAAVPQSVLWLLAGDHDARKDRIAANLRREMISRGLDPARLIFAARRPNAEYLGLYRRADLFLDTWPYNAHTTGSDSLWAGCPVLTWLGQTFAGRVGASLLTATGLPELIAADVDRYVEQAVELANDPALLLRYREHLGGAGHSSPLFETAATTRALEAAFTRIADQYCRGVREPFRIEAGEC